MDSYSDFFSPEEWVAIQTGVGRRFPTRSGATQLVPKLSSGAAPDSPDCAAQRDEVAPEDQSAARAKSAHSVTFAPRGDSDVDPYQVECQACGHLDDADALEEAQAIARLHEEFVAVLVNLGDAS